MFVAATAYACRAIIGLDSKSQHPSLDGWCCRILVICEVRKNATWAREGPRTKVQIQGAHDKMSVFVNGLSPIERKLQPQLRMARRIWGLIFCTIRKVSHHQAFLTTSFPSSHTQHKWFDLMQLICLIICFGYCQYFMSSNDDEGYVAFNFASTHHPQMQNPFISFLGSTYVGRLTESLFTSRSTFRLLPSNGFEASHAHALHARWISRRIAARIGQRSCDFKGSEPSNLRHEFLDTTVEQNTKNNNSVDRNFASIWHSDAEPIILEMGNSKFLVRLFGLDIETTWIFRDGERIIEFAIRDLSWGKNSCFQTLVNPERHVPNSHIHGITTKMVNRSRWCDFWFLSHTSCERIGNGQM